MKEAIVLQDMILVDKGAYYIKARNANGTLIAETAGAPRTAIAAFAPAVIKRRCTLRPIVGEFTGQNDHGTGLIYHEEPCDCTIEDWRRAVRAVPRLAWHHVLKGQVTFLEVVKVVLVNWSPDDLSKVTERQWFVGFSATSPLLRLYMLVPRPVWENDPDAAEMPVFDGQVHQVQRFGPILAGTDRCGWR